MEYIKNQIQTLQFEIMDKQFQLKKLENKYEKLKKSKSNHALNNNYETIKKDIMEFIPFHTTKQFLSKPFPKSFRTVSLEDEFDIEDSEISDTELYYSNKNYNVTYNVPGIGTHGVNICKFNGFTTPQDIYDLFIELNNSCYFAEHLMKLGIKRPCAIHCAYAFEHFVKNM